MSWTIYKKDGSERKVTWKAGEATGNGSIVVSGEVLTSAGRWAKPELEYSGTWMGECFVTLNISCAVPIDFEIGDYIIYRNEKFVINYDPTVIKKARRGTHGDGFVYDSVKFNSLSNELTDVRMLDYVIDDNGVHYSGLPKFSFFCDTVDALADRLQVNLNRYCDQNGITGNDRWLLVSPSQSKTHVRATSAGISTSYADEIWAQYYGGEDENIRTAYQEEKVNQNVSIDNNSVWDAMKYIKDTFGLNFVISGRVVAIGTAGLPTDVFSYGKGNGLYEIERVADSDQQIVTKLYCYGSDKNLPTRYYANIGMQCWSMIWTEEYGGEPIYCIYAEATSNIFKKPVTLSNPSIYFPPEVANLENAKVFEITFTYSDQVFQGYITDASVVNTEGVDLTGFSLLFGGDIPIFSRSDTITITNGIDKDKWPSHLRTSSSRLPNNMAVNVLMLPGFPNKSLYTWVTEHGGTAVEDAHNSDSIGRATWSPRQGVSYEAYFSKDNKQPYILSKNFTKLGIREATKYFDGSDGDEEIYPTIKNTGKDVIVQAQKVTDNGVFADGEEVSKFEVILPDFGEDFPLSGLLQNDTAIEMTDGYCGGRTFTIDSAEQLGNGNWKCTCNREEDMDLWFPYSDRASRGQEAIEDEAFQVRGADIAGYSGDHYVLTGIEMTETYVNAAAVTLLEAALNFLEKNDYTRYTYSPKIDELFMARQHDGFTRGDESFGDRSYHDTLKEGDIMLFDDDDLDVDGSVYIDTLQIKEYGNGCIPTYEVTLRNDKQVGTIQRMQEQLNSLTSGGGGGVYGGGGGGGSVNIPQIRQLIQSYGKELFLSKVANDAAKGVITFLNGLQAGAEGAWGWVKETYNNLSGGVAWFKNLLADYLQPTIVKVMNYLTGNEGSLIIHGDVFVTADPENNKSGDLNLAGDLNAENANIRNMLTTNNLTVTGLAHFFELIIDKIKAAGGAQLFTPADGFKVEDVTDTTINNTACKVLWWRATDGDRETTNMWEVGDQAICMNFNLTREREGEVMRDVENKNFWAFVAEKDDNPVLHTYGSSSSSSSSDEEDTVLSHYITIYTGTGNADSADEPRWLNNAYKVSIGDEIAMLGHRLQPTDYDQNNNVTEAAKARQTAVYISAYASYDTGNGDDLGPLQPPFLAFYKGIDDFNLGSHRGTYMDAKGSRFVGKFISSSTSQDIENMLRGSEFDIIYGVGNPNTVSHPHYAWNQEAGEYLSHVGWLYFDIDLEPATEGGRLWRWSYIDSDSSSSSSDEPYYTWVNINDVDSLAALDKIRDVASDGVLTGGAEKTRVYLEWVDAKKTTLSLLAQAEENGLDQADDEYYNISSTSSSSSDEEGHTYAEAYNNVDSTFRRLSTYLNNKTSFNYVRDGVPAWIDPQNIYVGIKVSTSLPAWLNTESPAGKAEWTTGPLAYRGVWSEFWDAVVELTRALNAWQYKTIEEMGDDGLIDSAEKAALRQMFSSELQRYFRMLDDFTALGGTSAHYDATHTLSNIVLSELNNLGTYLDGTDVDFLVVQNPSGNPFEKFYFEYDSQTGRYNRTSDTSVVAGKNYYLPEVDEITWEVNSEMRDGLTEEMFIPSSMESGDRTGYPRWLLKVNETRSQEVENDTWDYYWNCYWSKANLMEQQIALAKQYQIDHIDVDIALPYRYETDNTGFTNPMPGNPTQTPIKVGDTWYEAVKLHNPAISDVNDPDYWEDEDSNGQPLYNVYICYSEYNTVVTYANRFTKWKLTAQAVYSYFDNDGTSIKSAVFADDRYSSVVQNVNGITSTVSGLVNPSKNLLINGDFSDGTNHFAKSGNGSIEVVTGQGAANFSNTLKVTSVNGSACGIQFSINEQPYITFEEGKKYTLSFYAMASSSKTIYVQRPGSISSGKSISSTWGRYSQTFTGDGLAKTISIVDATSNTTTYYITGLQLEVGNSYTDWVAGSINLVNMQSQIVQTASEIELSVKSGDVVACGITLDGVNETVTLTGSKTVIDGDLDLKGLVTNSSQFIDYDDTYSIEDDVSTGFVHYNGEKMIVPVDLKKVKNIIVRGLSKDNSISGDDTVTATNPLIVLPGLSTKNNINNIADLDLPACTRSGVQLSITNSIQLRFIDWRNGIDHMSSAAGFNIWDSALFIVSDPNVVDYSASVNIQNSLSSSSMNNTFVVNGQAGKILILLPGQMLNLTSVVYQFGNSNVLQWYVDNPSDFTAINGEIRRWVATSESDDAAGAITRYPFSASDHYNKLSFFAPQVLSQEYSDDVCFYIMTQRAHWPFINLPTEFQPDSGNTTNYATLT